MSYDMQKFIQATAEYFKYASEADFTQIHQFIDLVKNNNEILHNLSKALWQPGVDMALGQIVISPNMQENTVAKVTAIGTTGETEPTWPTAGNTVTDGGVTYLMMDRAADLSPYARASQLATVAYTGAYGNLSGTPASLPANGGDADTVDGIHASGFLQLSNGYLPGIELTQATPFIDFHYNYSTADYTHRIIAISQTALQVDPGEVYLGNYLSLSRAGVSYSANGYLKLNDGFTLQWGTVSSTAIDTYITFPVTFRSVFSVVGSPITGSNLTGSQSNFAIKGVSNSGFYGNIYDNENGYAGFNWVAIGI